MMRVLRMLCLLYQDHLNWEITVWGCEESLRFKVGRWYRRLVVIYIVGLSKYSYAKNWPEGGVFWILHVQWPHREAARARERFVIIKSMPDHKGYRVIFISIKIQSLLSYWSDKDFITPQNANNKRGIIACKFLVHSRWGENPPIRQRDILSTSCT